MGKIRPLSENLIGKIAAGEVVERPAAAIKELIENSLDAGATAVTVEIQEGGLTSIRVADNGSGIDESDIRMAFERHATSKISREQDLDAIATLGFRGEALASIAAVSRITMTTRTAASDTGLKVKNEGGRITDIQEIACPVGTTIQVNDLFFNVPVRKGFMKKAGQEASAVHDLIVQLLLSRPDVSFRYISNGKTEFHSPGDGQTATALQTVYGSYAMKFMKEVNDHGNGLIIKGYVGIGENGRGNRNQEMFFINGRVMHNKILNEALETACRERVMIGKFPVCALYITIPYEAVDVNVHPNKLEVRFRDETGVYEAVLSAVLMALKEKDAFQHPVEMTLSPQKEKASDRMTEVPVQAAPAMRRPLPSPDESVTVSRTLPASASAISPAPKPEPVYRDIPPKPAETINIPAAGREYAAPTVMKENAEQVNTILSAVRKPMKVFGALFNTFILVEYEDQLLMVDQHAVHERLLFDRLMSEHTEKAQAGQEMLVPVVLGVTNAEQRLLEDNREALESIGLVVEAFGEKDVAVRTIPVILGEAQTKDFIRDVINDLQNGKDPTFEKKRTQLLQTACKHAVKGGETLTEEELRSLLDTMIEQKVTPTCPHGRPLVVSISHRELDRKFKRIQN
ncbi:DNA mismatch repair endonuclease MutL [Aristaeella hokkaidonensis]|uniref:DNA mismatch repair endonuclease MutL n=1 Tax=Aristaeella hokkaidonensis TaxID=3046382 RepID=A0AC61NBD9_9FIRM|nr:DNA mismatch repair endonuclease MutL [Aristaeella hokkaidonensis]QUC67916.1 DNA mismatch repair endonuclease MutL [Aristaeella hokkaidonensis]SNT92983.1 DNA mismatch repair protein MutL [Aristaeella hokkaidonensis]